ncbi:MAG: T9SS type A sorting domain-containing protein, partial [Bacteroidota bacterium]
VGNTTVQVSVGGNAQADDYTMSSNTVTFASGTTTTQNLTVSIMEDNDIESDENIELTISLVSGSDAVAANTLQTHTITITNDDDNDVPSVFVDEITLNANFEADVNGFTSANINGGPATFGRGQLNNLTSDSWTLDDTNTGDFMFVNDDRCNCEAGSVILLTPSLDFSNYDEVQLSFAHAFSDVGDESAVVAVSTDGANFTTIGTITNTSVRQGFFSSAYTTPWVYNNVVNLDAYAGNSTVTIGFVYSDGGGWAYGMAVDDVSITGRGGEMIQTAVNSSNGFFEQQLGPQETLHYYDSNSGNIMLTIRNTSNNDYGCTRVEVDRSGTGASNGWESGMDVTDKTFKITPQNTHNSGTIEVDLYYTEAEIAGWEARTNESRSDLRMLRADSDIATAGAGESQTPTNAAFGSTGQMYTATFSSGLNSVSGLALGNRGTALPLELLSFTATAAAQQINLEWTTDQEYDNAGFYVQRSTDALQYTNLAWVASAKNNTVGSSAYRYEDKTARRGVTYFYRLLQVDKNANESFSPLRSATLSTTVQVSFSPNPVTDMLYLEIGQAEGWIGQMTIHDLSGKLWHIEEVTTTTTSRQSIDVSQLPAGMYWLSINDNNQFNYTEKLIKLGAND